MSHPAWQIPGFLSDYRAGIPSRQMETRYRVEGGPTYSTINEWRRTGITGPVMQVEPQWEPIRQPDVLTIAATVPRNARDGLSLAIKCADTQIGFRRFDDGSLEPFHDEQAMDLFIEVCRLYQPDKIQILGDFLDLPSQGRFAKEAAFARTTQMALDAGYKFLASLRAVCPSADMTIIEGNHDKRLQNFVEVNTVEAFGLKRAGLDELPVMSIPYLLRLEDLDITYIDAYPAASEWDNAYTRNIHGTRASSTGSTTSQYIREVPQINTWAAHTHRTEITYKTSVGQFGVAHEAYSANPGCLCRTDGAVPSVKGGIHSDGSSARVVEDWQQGFGFNWFDEEQSWPSVYRIRNGTTIIDGRLIQV
jgi:hypothetical protein